MIVTFSTNLINKTSYTLLIQKCKFLTEIWASYAKIILVIIQIHVLCRKTNLRLVNGNMLFACEFNLNNLMKKDINDIIYYVDDKFKYSSSSIKYAVWILQTFYSKLPVWHVFW